VPLVVPATSAEAAADFHERNDYASFELPNQKVINNATSLIDA
jgi:hypothetical protein